MRTLRILILLAIIVLVGLAFYAKGPDGFFSSTESSTESGESSAPGGALEKMQKMVEERLPQLRGDGEKLLGGLTDLFKDLNAQAKDVIASVSPDFAKAFSGIIDSATPMTEAAKEDISQDLEELKEMGEALRQKGQEELARRVEDMYQKIKTKLDELESTPQ
ncbi:MAG TPA: hypothetical protein PK878_12165 [bacterium]|nr:hypothetical protein [Candidatus Omnitrophota bacterium]HOJ61033.1 hypothetical protein [bacterium]HOL95306.1 hypothetical protein [bacterium]HPP02956.1 hypothetical protein [bacterium]HXK94367.1 hypothetical protein [bacterium]